MFHDKEKTLPTGPTSQVAVGNNKHHNRTMQVSAVSQINPNPITNEEGMFAHLLGNRFIPSPEIPSNMVYAIIEACLTAVMSVRQGDLEKVIKLPPSVPLNGADAMQAHEFIELFDLEDWLV